MNTIFDALKDWWRDHPHQVGRDTNHCADCGIEIVDGDPCWCTDDDKMVCSDCGPVSKRNLRSFYPQGLVAWQRAMMEHHAQQLEKHQAGKVMPPPGPRHRGIMLRK